MKRTEGCLAAVVALAISAAGVEAQAVAGDGWLLPPGTLRVGLAMEYAHFDRRFGAGGTEPWSAELAGPLDASAFAPLAAVGAGLEAFFGATGGPPAAGTGSLTLGEVGLGLSADTRSVPLEIALGVLPRVEIGLTLPVFRSELHVSRFDLAGGNVGANPAPDANAMALAAFGAEFEALGRSRLLPVKGSPLGDELTARVEAAGGEILLPAVAAGDSLLNAVLVAELAQPPIETYREPWRLGDATAHVRVLLLTTMGGSAFPADSGAIHYRISTTAGARLPSGAEPGTPRLFVPNPPVGLSGWSAGIGGDLFVGRRVWIAGSAGYSAAGTVEVLRRVHQPGRPFASADPPRLVRWSPPTQLRVRVSPRWRLEESLAVGVDYDMLRLGASGYEGDAAAVSSSEGGSAQRLGGSVRFSTLPGRAEGENGFPFEAALAYSRTLSGPDGHPAAARLTVEGRLYHPLWGRSRRR